MSNSAPFTFETPKLPPRPGLHRPQFIVGGGLAVDGGILPGWGAAPSLTLGLRYGAFRLDLVGHFWPQRRGFAPMSTTAGGDLMLGTGAARGCVLGTLERVSLGGCAGVEVGGLYAKGFGVAEPGDALSPWVAASLMGDVTVVVAGPFAVRLQLGGAVPFVRPAYVLDPLGLVHRPPQVALRGQIDLELHF